MYDVQTQVSDLFGATHIQEYKHWKTGDDWIDLTYELSKLRQQKLQEPYGVFAKSIGTVLGVQAIQRGIIKPKFLLFCGVPLDFIIANFSQCKEVLKTCNIPTVLIHNEDDVIGSAQKLKQYLGDELASKVVVTPGNTHDYEDYTLLKHELTKLKAVA